MPAYPLDQTANRNLPQSWNGACPATPAAPAGGNGPGNSAAYPLQQQPQQQVAQDNRPWYVRAEAQTEQFFHSAYQTAVELPHDIEDKAIRSKHFAQALMRADLYVSPQIERRLGMEVEELKQAFLPGLLIALGALALTTLGGAAIGAAIGFFGGAGVGALPGAIVGGELGLDAGLYALDLLGIGMLLKQVADSIPGILNKVRQAAQTAWNAGVSKPDHLQSDIDNAAHQFADAEADLVVLAVEGVLAWLISESAVLREAKIFRGVENLSTKAARAARAEELLTALRNSPAEVEALLQRAADDLAARLRKASRLMDGLADFIQKRIKQIVEKTTEKARESVPKRVEAEVGSASVGSDAAATPPRAPKRPLQERKGDVDSYGELKKTTGDGSVDRDHQPSKAALLKRAQQLKGSRLTPAEESRIINDADAVVVPKDIHKAGPTYGSKNTPDLISSDASDLSTAASRDADKMVENAGTMDPKNVSKYQSAADQIKGNSNGDYDDWLNDRLDDDEPPADENDDGGN